MENPVIMRALVLFGVGAALALPEIAAADSFIPVRKEAPAHVPSPHAAAARLRWVTVPGWTLSPYLAKGTELYGGVSAGLEYIYRRPAFDIVTSLDYSWLNPPDGNFLGKGNDPAKETHYVHFSGLSALSADVSIIGHFALLPWLEIRAGAGLGLGVVFGNVFLITNNSGCTAQNAGDPRTCYPSIKDPPDQRERIGPLDPKSPSTLATLEGAGCANGDSSLDTPESPCYRRYAGYPFSARIVPVINTMIGLRFRVHPRVFIHADAGWRLVGFYFGVGPEVRF